MSQHGLYFTDEFEQKAEDDDGILYNPDDQRLTSPSYDSDSDGILRSDPSHRGLPAGSPGST